MSVVVQVEGLQKSYGPTRALTGISFEVHAGEMFGLLGPNGAGKTTTTEILEGLLLPDAGSVDVLGCDVRTQLEQVKQRIGIQLQATALFSRLTVREHLELFASFYDHALEADEVLRIVHLEDKAHSLCSRLSGGQRQRLAIGLALVNEPEIVFLDEPTTGLDPQVRIHVLDMIADLRTRGKTIFMTTHYMEEAERLCDRVAVMDHGQIIACAEPKRLIDEHSEYSVVELAASTLSAQRLAAMPSVLRVQTCDQTFVVQAKQPAEFVGAVWKAVQSSGGELGDLRIRRASLEDVFLKLTGRPLRE
jgi:ABC-2 type transport system ATP-binding protein